MNDSSAIKIEGIDEEAPILDDNALDTIKMLADDDEPDFVENLINIFLGRMPPLVVEIAKSANSGSHSDLERSAHSLKGSSGNIGAMAMMKVCAKLEEMGRNQEMKGAPQLAAALETLSQQTESMLRQNWLK